MIDLRSLYQDVILDHSRSPRNSGSLEPHSHEANGNNPLCGDKVRVYMQVGNGKIDDIRVRSQRLRNFSGFCVDDDRID